MHMQKTKKIPLRQCAGCGQMFDKRSLVRVVRSPEGLVSVDLTGKKPGRGAYVCKNVECLKKAKKIKRLERVFETTIGENVYEMLAKELTEIEV